MTNELLRCCERALTLVVLAWGLCGTAQAHKASDAYLQVHVQPEAVDLRWDIALRDLESLVEVDANGDRRVTWGEVKQALPLIEAQAVEHLQVAGCTLQIVGRGLERRSDGTYVALQLHGACTPPVELPIRYTLFAGVDATHRGIARIDRGDGQTELRLLDPAHPTVLPVRTAATPAAPGRASDHPGEVRVRSDVQPTSASSSFVLEGVRHILSGYDHLLFLLCLLLPSVLRRTPQGWQPVDNARQALGPVLRIVTLFTLAHSITLSLAALGKVDLPSSFIEPAIAATIAVAALDNLRPVFGRWRGAVTFAFGLVHGFGFAGVLRELQLPTAEFASALLRFNLGIELGQLAVVGCAVPLLLWQRGRPAYPRWVLRAGSSAAIALAAVWFVERAADISLLPV
jgi:hypothetical protein